MKRRLKEARTCRIFNFTTLKRFFAITCGAENAYFAETVIYLIPFWRAPSGFWCRNNHDDVLLRDILHYSLAGSLAGYCLVQWCWQRGSPSDVVDTLVVREASP
jgi:hypothetical protein